MLYQKIGEQKYPIDKFSTFITQMGNSAIRIVGDVPLADNGFLIVDDNDNVIGDMSEYTYLYREDSKCKEYTKVAETPIPAESYASGDTPITPYDVLSRRISAVNNRVTEITPYTETKRGYIGEVEKMFYNVPDGNVSVFFDNYNGSYGIHRESDRVKVFVVSEGLKQETDITIMVQ